MFFVALTGSFNRIDIFWHWLSIGHSIHVFCQAWARWIETANLNFSTVYLKYDISYRKLCLCFFTFLYFSPYCTPMTSPKLHHDLLLNFILWNRQFILPNRECAEEIYIESKKWDIIIQNKHKTFNAIEISGWKYTDVHKHTCCFPRVRYLSWYPTERKNYIL